LDVRPRWSLPGLAPWATVEEQLESEYGPLGPEWGTPVGEPEDLFAEIAAGLGRQPDWQAWAERWGAARVQATLVVEDRAVRATRVRRGPMGVGVDHRVPVSVFASSDVALYEIARELVSDVWTAAAAELGWDPPPALPRRKQVCVPPPAAESDLDAVDAMAEKRFWQLIDTLPGRVSAAGAERLSARLAEAGGDAIQGFAERLALALYALDTEAHASQPVHDADESPGDRLIPLSADAFLHVRCAVVAAGRETYERVRNDPSKLAGTWEAEEAEDLLFVAANAWQQLTGEEWAYQTAVDFETGSNQAGWQ